MAERLPYPYPDPATDQWDPFAMLRNLQFLAEKIEQAIPTGTIVLVKSGSTCPSGFAKLATGDASYIRISTGSAGGTGGDLSVSVVDSGHTHGAGTLTGPSHTHGVGTIADSGHNHDAGSLAAANHNHSIGVPGGTELGVNSGSEQYHNIVTHTHGGATGNEAPAVSGTTANNAASLGGNTGAGGTGSVGGSSASGTTGVTGTIAPTYVDFILCEKS